MDGKVERKEAALAKPSGLLVAFTAKVFLMSRNQKSSLPIFPCAKLQKVSENALPSSLKVRGTSLARSTALDSGSVKVDRGLTQNSGLLEDAPGVLVRRCLQC